MWYWHWVGWGSWRYASFTIKNALVWVAMFCTGAVSAAAVSGTNANAVHTDYGCHGPSLGSGPCSCTTTGPSPTGGCLKCDWREVLHRCLGWWRHQPSGSSHWPGDPPRLSDQACRPEAGTMEMKYATNIEPIKCYGMTHKSTSCADNCISISAGWSN